MIERVLRHFWPPAKVEIWYDNARPAGGHFVVVQPDGTPTSPPVPRTFPITMTPGVVVGSRERIGVIEVPHGPLKPYLFTKYWATRGLSDVRLRLTYLRLTGRWL